MANLNIASRANQAVTFPALLLAARANDADPNAIINIKFEDVDKLKGGDGAVAELILGTSSPVFGTEKIIASLITSYASLQEKQEENVK